MHSWAGLFTSLHEYAVKNYVQHVDLVSTTHASDLVGRVPDWEYTGYEQIQHGANTLLPEKSVDAVLLLQSMSYLQKS